MFTLMKSWKEQQHNLCLWPEFTESYTCPFLNINTPSLQLYPISLKYIPCTSFILRLYYIIMRTYNMAELCPCFIDEIQSIQNILHHVWLFFFFLLNRVSLRLIHILLCTCSLFTFYCCILFQHMNMSQLTCSFEFWWAYLSHYNAALKSVSLILVYISRHLWGMNT